MYASTMNPDEPRSASNHHNTTFAPLETLMNAYRPDTPRLALGFAAIALTAVTIGLLALAPARMDFRSQQVPVIALSDASPQAITDTGGADTLIGSIDVRAVRGSRLVTVVESRSVQQAKLRG
jgi:hypothetical protein